MDLLREILGVRDVRLRPRRHAAHRGRAGAAVVDRHRHAGLELPLKRALLLRLDGNDRRRRERRGRGDAAAGEHLPRHHRAGPGPLVAPADALCDRDDPEARKLGGRASGLAGARLRHRPVPAHPRPRLVRRSQPLRREPGVVRLEHRLRGVRTRPVRIRMDAAGGARRREPDDRGRLQRRDAHRGRRPGRDLPRCRGNDRLRHDGV